MKTSTAELKTAKKHEYDLPEKAFINLQATSDGPIKAYIVDTSGVEHLLAASLQGSLNLKTSIAGSSKLSLRGDRSITAKCQTYAEQIEEPRHDEPAFIPDYSNNPLRQMREKVRAEMGVMREAFELIADTGLPGYELDDDAPDHFEEDLAALTTRHPKTTRAEPEGTEKPTQSETEPSGDDTPASS